MCFKQKGEISILSAITLKLGDQFIYLGSNSSSTKSDVNIHLAKTLNAIDKLSIKWKSDLSDKMKWDFFQDVAVFILLYGCTTWRQAKCSDKRFDGNFTRRLRVILNKSWKQHAATVWPPSSHLTNHSIKTNKTCEALLEKQGKTHKRRFLINLHTSVLCGHKMLSRRPSRCDGGEGWIGRESVWELCATSETR